jgi:hypothetical protein
MRVALILLLLASPALADAGAAENARDAGQERAADAEAFERKLAEARRQAEKLRFAAALRTARRLERAHPQRFRERELGAWLSDLRAARQKAPQLRYALRQMGQGRSRHASVAGRQLLKAGEVGERFLRKGLREEPPAVAAEAAILLVKAGAEDVAPLLLTRLKEAEDPWLRRTLFAQLRKIAGRLSSAQAREAHARMRAVEGWAKRRWAGVLAHHMQKACGADEETYNNRLQDERAHARLKALVNQAREAEDPKVRQWAARTARHMERMPMRGMALWLRPGTELRFDGEKRIARWSDASAHQRHAEQPDASKRPRRGDTSSLAHAAFGGEERLIFRGFSYDERHGIRGLPVLLWVKTEKRNNDRLFSFDRSETWAVREQGGRVLWSTSAADTGIDDFGGGARISDGQWHQVVVTFDGAANEKRIYVDGELDRKKTAHGDAPGLGTGTPRFGALAANSEASGFGGRFHNSRFQGRIGEAAVWHRVLPAASIEALYARRASGWGEGEDAGGS